MCTHMHTYIHTHIRTHTHIHTHTYTHTRTAVPLEEQQNVGTSVHFSPYFFAIFFPLRSKENGQAWAEIFKGLKTDSEYDPTNAYKALKPVKWIKGLKVIHVSKDWLWIWAWLWTWAIGAHFQSQSKAHRGLYSESVVIHRSRRRSDFKYQIFGSTDSPICPQLSFE